MTRGGQPAPRFRRSQFPALPPGWLARERLHARLARAIEHPVTTVTGPPGSGKTVLLSGWAQHGAPPVAWLSVERTDNEPAEPAGHEPAGHEPAANERAANHPGRDGLPLFWRRLRGAIEAVDAGLAAGIRPATIGAGNRRSRDQVAAPVSSPATAPVVLILDDVQLLGPEASRVLGALLADLPSRLRVILAGRHLSRLPIEEWRGRHRWGEIAPPDLRFTPDEAVALFAASPSSALPDDAARALADRTEGWAAGLRLADLMSPLFSDPAALLAGFTGEARLLAEYFNHELIERRPARQVRFLLASSALDLLTAEGCAAVTGHSDAGVLLETLCRQHLLLERSDPAVPSYRYHQLFHEFLRHKLHTEAPAIARLSHLRAAAWCEAHHDDRSSVRHLIEAGSYPEAFGRGLVAVVGTLDGRYLPGGASLAITDLPDRFVEQDVVRTYVVAAAHLAGLRPDDAAVRLRTLERQGREDPDRTGLPARAELLRAFAAALQGDPDRLLFLYERAVELDRPARERKTPLEPAPVSDTARPVHDLDRLLWRHVGALAAAAHVCLGDPDAARAALLGVAEDRGPLDEVDRLSVEARVAGYEGRLQTARLLAEAALEAGRRSAQTGSISTLGALRTLAAVLYEYDDLDGSEARLREAKELCVAARLVPWRAVLACDEAGILIARGSTAHALYLLRPLRDPSYDDPRPASLRPALDRVEIRCRLALGDLDGAAHLVQSLPITARPVEIVARLDLAAGRPDRAAERLVGAGHHPRRRVAIERLLLLSRAYLQLGDEARGDIALQRAIDHGRPDGFVRAFVDEGAEVAGALTRIPARFVDPYVAELRARSAVRLPASRRVPTGVLEPFTERERELLSYLPSHLSQHEIAGVMYISLNTVKTHTKAVYRKLGATCRAEAVDAARVHGLL